jgi:hypothetical protein
MNFNAQVASAEHTGRPSTKQTLTNKHYQTNVAVEIARGHQQTNSIDVEGGLQIGCIKI